MTLWGGLQGAIWAHFRPKKWGFFINYIRIVWFMWDFVFVSLDSSKDVVSGKILVFGNILCFPGVNWAQIWTKTVNFGTSRFPLKTSFWKILLILLFLMIFYLWSKFQQNLITFVEVTVPKPSKWAISWMLHCHQTIWKSITWEIQMLQTWNLPRLCISIRPFIWRKIWGATQKAQEGVNEKPLKITQKLGFSTQFWPFI